MSHKPLREGFTTGSAASAAAKAAATLLLTGQTCTCISIPLPPGQSPDLRLDIPIAELEQTQDGQAAWATVIKDGGDDPDATHGAAIRCRVAWSASVAPGEVGVEGGEGVGRVTRPGLPVAVGQPAINPAPRKQIEAALREALGESIRQTSCGLLATVCVPDGERLAAKTMNPRLGIVDGISILGTRGTVKPFSHEAYQATIREALDVARADGLDVLACSTGRGSERLLRAAKPKLPDLAFVQVADFYGFTLREAASRGFQDLSWGCYFGKFVKMSQGLDNTHAHAAPLDFEALAATLAAAGLPAAVVTAARQANTARQVWGLVALHAQSTKVLHTLGRQAVASAQALLPNSARCPRLSYYVFDFGGKLLGRFGE